MKSNDFKNPNNIYLDRENNLCLDWYSKDDTKSLYLCLTPEKTILLLSIENEYFNLGINDFKEAMKRLE